MNARTLTLVPLILPFVMGCQSPAPSPLAWPSLNLVECPHDWPFGDSVTVSQRPLVVQHSGLPDVGRPTNIPEFNDCQRFIVRDPTTGELRFEKYFAIFAAKGLDSIADLPPGLARVAAVIYAEGPYKPLGIVTEFSCLFLFRVGEAGRVVWKAKMVPKGFVELPDCGAPIDPFRTEGTDLEVAIREVPGPAAARWQWDWTREQQFIGIGCAKIWCDIGPKGFDPGPDVYATQPATVSRTVRQFPGLYDEQLLALKDDHGQFVPSVIWGTIFPDPNLSNDTRDYDHWQPVAYVALRRAPGLPSPDFARQVRRYRDRYGFDSTSANDTDLDTLFLCKGQQCADDAAAEVPSCGSQWRAKVWSPLGIRYKCIARHFEGEVTIPGTARWRWHAKDEGWWTPCVQGCCQDEQ